MGGLLSFYHHHLHRLGVESANHENGLTLIELMVVVVILGIISAVAIPSISSAITSAKVSTTESDLATIQQALQRYYINNNQYPPNLTDLTSKATISVVGGPYLDVTFPDNDAWGKPIWYGPLTLTANGTGPVSGYYLYSMGGNTITTSFGGNIIPIGSIIAGGGSADPSTSGGYSQGNTKQTPFIYTAQDSNMWMYNWGSLNPSLGSGSAGATGGGYTNWVTS